METNRNILTTLTHTHKIATNVVEQSTSRAVFETTDETTFSNGMELIINHEYTYLVPQISESDYQSIKQSIKDSGQWVPIIINPHRIILDGQGIFIAARSDV